MQRSALQKYHLATHRTHVSNRIHFRNVYCLMDVHTCLNRSQSQWQKDKLYDMVQQEHYRTMCWADTGRAQQVDTQGDKRILADAKTETWRHEECCHILGVRFGW